MDSAVRIIVALFAFIVLILADPLFIPHSLSNGNASVPSQHAKYHSGEKYNQDAPRRPDRKLFELFIFDESDHLISSHEDVLAYKWAPNSISYSFVKDDQVYYVSTPGDDPVKISEGNVMRHGTFDWMFTEEIFGRGRHEAMWFSPSNKYLAYASRPVNASKEMLLTTYAREENYNYNYNMEYPKTGEERIAQYYVSIYNVVRDKSITMDVLFRDPESFHYLFAVSWVVLHGKELLMTTWANRWQNETSITLCSYDTGMCSLIYEHKYESAQWATPSDYVEKGLEMVHSNSSLFVILPESRGDNAWQHIAMIEITTEIQFKSISFLRVGDYDVTKLKEYLPEDHTIRYEAQAPNPWNKNEYLSPAGENSAMKTDKCTSCLDSPSLNETQHQSEIEQHDNNTLKQCKIEYVTLHNGYEAIVQICEGDDKNSSIPVFLEVYGGPTGNKVKERNASMDAPWAEVHIDVRGSGGRGWKYRSPIYGRLATVEVDDTIEAMQLFLDKYPRLDRSRVGVYGWSFGGTLTLAMVERAPPGFFKCALAGAPVANFMYYDAAYTERYMGDAPPSSYTDLTANVSAFNNTTLLLVHGMRDDNVHFQNSALLIEALEKANITFQTMVYPNEDHNSAVTNSHFRRLQKNFFDDCYA